MQARVEEEVYPAVSRKRRLEFVSENSDVGNFWKYPTHLLDDASNLQIRDL